MIFGFIMQLDDNESLKKEVSKANLFHINFTITKIFHIIFIKINLLIINFLLFP